MHDICMLFSEDEGDSERFPKIRQYDSYACKDVQAPAPLQRREETGLFGR